MLIGGPQVIQESPTCFSHIADKALYRLTQIYTNDDIGSFGGQYVAEPLSPKSSICVCNAAAVFSIANSTITLNSYC